MGPMKMTREPPPLLVRADANVTSGTGHVMRCLALAEAWRRRGGGVHFVTCQPAPTLCQRIESAGAQVIALDAPYPSQNDAELTLSTLAQLARRHETLPWLVVDGYHFDAAYLDHFHASSCRRLIVDDFARLPYYDADILLNHGVHAPRLEYPACPSAWQLLGTRYALLRGEFSRWRNFARSHRQRARNILVTLGGSDRDNVTVKVIEALRSLGLGDIDARVIVGPLHAHFDELRSMVAADERIRLHTGVTDLAPVMAWADLAIAAGGTTAWELAFMQVPTLLLVLAENQSVVARGSDEFGAARSLGWAGEISSDEIAGELGELIADCERRAAMGKQGRLMVDGLGAQRVITAMDERMSRAPAGNLWVRSAGSEDSLLIWQWANDPGTRLRSFNPAPIPWHEHAAWFGAKLNSSTCRMWIMQIGDLPVGQIRYERVDSWEGPCAEISISTAPGFRGIGLGTKLLEATAELAAVELAVRWLKGVAFSNNQASRRAFLNARFDATESCNVGGRACSVFRRACGVALWKESHVPFH